MAAVECSNVPGGPGDGNISHPLAKWVFTENFAGSFSNWLDIDKTMFKAIRWQCEKVGHLHLQGCFWLKKKNRKQWLINNLSETAYYAPARNWEKSWNYVGKPETYTPSLVDGKLYSKFIYEEKKRITLEEVVKLCKVQGIRETIKNDDAAFCIAVNHSNGLPKMLEEIQGERDWPMQVFVIVGPPGCGKTRFVYDRHGKQNVFKWNWRTKFFCGYRHEEVVLIDDFDGCGINYEVLLELLDRYPMIVELKGSHTNFNSKRIFITSNVPYQDWYKGVPNKSALTRRVTQFADLNYMNSDILNWLI